jgi:hypothetical protein
MVYTWTVTQVMTSRCTMELVEMPVSPSFHYRTETISQFSVRGVLCHADGPARNNAEAPTSAPRILASANLNSPSSMNALPHQSNILPQSEEHPQIGGQTPPATQHQTQAQMRNDARRRRLRHWLDNQPWVPGTPRNRHMLRNVFRRVEGLFPHH